jgi:hypothetical protein
MCPVCISAIAVMVAGATSTGGVTALVVKKFSPRNGTKRITPQPHPEKTHCDDQ